METFEERYQEAYKNKGSRLSRVLRPLGRLAHPFRGRDPFGVNMYPYNEGPSHPWPNTISLTPSADGPIATLARIVLDERLDLPPDEANQRPIMPGDP